CLRSLFSNADCEAGILFPSRGNRESCVMKCYKYRNKKMTQCIVHKRTIVELPVIILAETSVIFSLVCIITQISKYKRIALHRKTPVDAVNVFPV
ncbi:MAG TPA: hypothetical protein VK602_02785, partial [Phyllobacterium sp.]|nr:hypothetical protein [Phyllobacterium sp.]